MLVNWSGKLGQIFGGRIFRILILFLCALAILVGIYRSRGNRIEKEQLLKNRPLKHSATSLHSSSTSSRWVIVANPVQNLTSSDEFVCSVARVARDSSQSWKTIIIGDKVECCRMPDCYSIHTSQFLRMSYRTATTLRSLLEAEAVEYNATYSGSLGQNPGYTSAYKEVVRNLAYIWVIHRGARHIFDAYVDEYIAAGVSIPKFEEELSRQLQNLALDESLALVEDHKSPRSTRGGGLFRNPYSHFGRPDIRLVPGGTGSGFSPQLSHVPNGNNYNLHLARHSIGGGAVGGVPLSAAGNASRKASEFPNFRICEVRPPSIEKFLEIDNGWWDLRAPALVLPGDTMPPLCTRNTMFSPDVFWALPILPDYASGSDKDLSLDDNSTSTSTSRIPPWYIRGLWSQSLLGDLGGSIRLTLSRVPTLQLNQNYFTGGDYEPSSSPSSSKLLKRWHCKSRSTYRCLLLMSKELSKSVYLRRHDLALVESWIIDLKSIHYAEPPMLPRRRSHTNPCLGADGLHGVSFFPALDPSLHPESEYFSEKRNDTLRTLVAAAARLRVKREDYRGRSSPSSDLTPPPSSYFPTDWTAYTPPVPGSYEDKSLAPGSSYYSHFRDAFRELEDSPSADFVRTLVTHSKAKAELAEKSKQSRSGKQFLTQPTSSEASEDEFPILTAMAENLCPGFGPLIPYRPSKTYDDLLLIVVFSNQHYDLIPTLEVLYRSSFPNMLYCGHPHVSVDLFLRKYQTAEHRSFSFLPTYTRATYECVLGAMEMNYEVKGYLVISDETLMKSWNIEDLDKNKIWVSSSTTHPNSRHVPVTKASWRNLDQRGQKLPRLLDGIINTWKLFSYILVGHDGWIMDKTVAPGVTGGPKRKRSVDEESLETGESSYVPVQIEAFSDFGANPDNETDPGRVETKSSNALKSEDAGSGTSSGTTSWDLSPSDWDNKTPSLTPEQALSSNETASEGDGDVEVGDENDDNESTPWGGDSSSNSSAVEQPPIVDDLEVVSESGSSSPELLDGSDNSSVSSSPKNDDIPEEPLSTTTLSSSTTATSTPTSDPDSSVGVPLYHVEHAEPPTPPTWHRPEDGESTLAPLPEHVANSTTTAPPSGESSTKEDSWNITSSSEDSLDQGSSSSYQSTRDGAPLPISSSPSPITTPTPTPGTFSSTQVPTFVPTPTSSGAPPGSSTASDAELGREMELLLEHVQDVYLNMLHIVSEYKESNDSTQKSHEFSSEAAQESRSLLEDTKSHRISPREFRHIRCTLTDDGHQSDLCSSLRNFIATLGSNLGGEIELAYDTIPMYYLPSWSTKSFYSVANVLLHFGVMDELALPLLFRGLAAEGDWVNLRRSAALKVISEFENDSRSAPAATQAAASSEEEVLSGQPAHYFHPFNLHKVHSDLDKRKLFCSNYLLKVFQM